LQLNVFAPKAGKNKPVLIFVHGGGLLFGSAHHNSYNMTKFVEHTGIVIVTINYRLGVEATFAHPLLTKEDPNHPSSGAYALEDQRFAFQWVQRNIKNFGGDPNRVTIMGESAGGQSVMYHIFSPLSEGLFQNAIVASGPLSNPLFTLEEAEKYRGGKLEAKFGKFNSADEIRALSHEEVTSVLSPHLELAFEPSVPREEADYFLVNGPVGDGYNLPSPYDPYTLLREGKFNKNVRVIFGTCERESDFFFARFMLGLSEEFYDEILAATYGKGAPLLKEVIDRDHAEVSLFGKLAYTSTYTFFVCPAQTFAKEMARHGVDVRVFQWRAFPEKSPLQTFGAHHFVDTLYQFGAPEGIPGVEFSEEDVRLSRRVMEWIAQFVEGKDEIKIDESFVWDRYDPTNERTLIVDHPKTWIDRNPVCKTCEVVNKAREGEKHYVVSTRVPWEREPLLHKFLNVVVLGSLQNPKPALAVVTLFFILLVTCLRSPKGGSTGEVRVAVKKGPKKHKVQ
jgi:para-nitrobenzyl esterase